MEIGDIGLVHSGGSVIARGITLWMKIYLDRQGLDWRKLEFIPHHSFTLVEVWGQWMVAEANATGYQVRPLLEAYSVKDWKERIVIMTPTLGHTQEQKKHISMLASNFSMKVTRYDFLNFYFQMLMILTGVWKGPTGEKAKRRLYCTEASCTIENTVTGYFPEPWKKNPVDIMQSNFLKIREKGVDVMQYENHFKESIYRRLI